MALKDMSIETMVACSAAWLDPNQQRPLLEKYPLLKALIPKIRSAHDALTLAHNSSAPCDLDRDRLHEAIIEADDDFDRLARGLSRLLRGLAEVASAPAKREFWRETRALFFPSGLSIVNYTYLAEVEALNLLKTRVSDEVLTRLEHTPIADTHLRAIFDAWVDAGSHLENLVRQRDALDVGKALSLEGDSADALKPREDWIRAVRMLRDSMMIEGVDEETSSQLMRPLRDAKKSPA